MQSKKIHYGRNFLAVEFPEDWEIIEARPKDIAALSDPKQAVHEALASLDNRYIAGGRLRVAIAINDQSRPVPHEVILPPLVRWLLELGYNQEDITFIVATGTHAPLDRETVESIVPKEISERFRILSHDAKDEANLVDLGKTSRGTPCLVNRIYAEADLKLAVGNIEPHQFMGWSGGVKSVSIGLAGYPTITANHRMLSMDGCGPCRYDDNPMRQDVEEIGRQVGVDAVLNIVMNGNKEIVGVFAGDGDDVMRRATVLAKEVFSIPTGAPSDLTIASPGGHPKDLNFYQSQKALRHAGPATRPGAPIILTAACPDGVGHPVYQRWMEGKESHEQVMEDFEKEEFRLGHHKGMLVAKDAIGRDVYLVSELDDRTVESLLLLPATSLQAVVDDFATQWAITERSGSPRVLLLPYGNATIPLAETPPR